MPPIVVASDFTEEAARALAYVAPLAARLGSPVHLIHVIEYDPAYFASKLPGHWFSDEVVVEARKKLEDLAAESASSSVRIVPEVLVKPFPDAAIVEYAREVGALLVVLGGETASDAVEWIMGSITQGITSTAHCPVLIVKKDHLLPPLPGGHSP